MYKNIQKLCTQTYRNIQNFKCLDSKQNSSKTSTDSIQLTNEDKAKGQKTDNRSNSFLNLSLSHENNLQYNRIYSTVPAP